MKYLYEILCLLLLTACLLCGCSKVVGGYPTYSIQEFDDFWTLDEASAQEQYICDGNLNFAKVQNLIVVPFLKVSSHTETTLFLHIYSISEPPIGLMFNYTLTSSNGETISAASGIETHIEWTQLTDNLKKGTIEVQSFTNDSNWFYDDNKLELLLEFNIDGIITSAAYEINIIGHQYPAFPT